MKNLLVFTVAVPLLLGACAGEVKESDEAAITNQAESIERAANATTDRMIQEIEDDARAEAAAKAGTTGVASPQNSSQP